MTAITAELKALVEKMGKAQTAAQGFIKLSKEEPGKKAEHLAAFDKAFEEFKTAKIETQTLEAQEEKLAEMRESEEALAEMPPKPRINAPAEQVGAEKMTSDAAKELHTMAADAYVRGQKGKVQEALSKLVKEAGEEAFALLSNDGTGSTFLIPDDYRAQLIKNVAAEAAFRSAGARVITTNRQQVVWPSLTGATGSEIDIRTSGVAGSWRKEGEIGTDATAPSQQNQPTWGNERIPIFVWQPDAIVVSPEFLDDSAIDVLGEITDLLGETRVFDEDTAFTTGDGVDRPHGITGANSGIPTVNSGAAGDVTYGGMVDLYVGLPAQYRRNAKLMMTSAFYGLLLKLEDTAGNNIIPPNSVPGTLWQKKIVFNEYMPAAASASRSVAFADFRRLYVIAERKELRISRLNEKWFPNVGVVGMTRLGGKTVRPRAGRILVLSS